MGCLQKGTSLVYLINVLYILYFVYLENSLEFFQCFSRLSQEILAFFASLVVFLLSCVYRYQC